MTTVGPLNKKANIMNLINWKSLLASTLLLSPSVSLRKIGNISAENHKGMESIRHEDSNNNSFIPTQFRDTSNTETENKIKLSENNEQFPFENFSSFGNWSMLDDELTIDDYLEFIYPKSWTWVLIVFHCIVFVIGLVGNCLVCIAVYRNHSMRTVTNYFIVNLAVADALVILFCLPFSVVWDVTSTWWFGTGMCKFVLYIQSVSVTVSVLTLAFISMDRWYAICFPLKFKSTTGRAKTAIVIIWVIALACEIPEPIYLTAKPYNESFIYFTQCTITWTAQTDTVFMIVKMVFFYVFPLLLMSIAYIQIIRVLWKSGNALHQPMVSDQTGSGRTGQTNTFAMNMNTSTEGQLRSRRKAAKMLVAVVVMFAFCFLPVHLLSVLRLTVKLTNSELNRAFSLISHWLCYANSAINPIIYNFMSGKFRKEFKSAFSKCSQLEHTDFNGTRTSTYIYRYTTTTNRHSSRSKVEMIPMNSVK